MMISSVCWDLLVDCSLQSGLSHRHVVCALCKVISQPVLHSSRCTLIQAIFRKVLYQMGWLDEAPCCNLSAGRGCFSPFAQGCWWDLGWGCGYKYLLFFQPVRKFCKIVCPLSLESVRKLSTGVDRPRCGPVVLFPHWISIISFRCFWFVSRKKLEFFS